MPCTIINTNDPLILNLKIEPDNIEGDLNVETLKDIKYHIQSTLLLRHYKKFIWDLKDVTIINTALFARILMGYEKSLNSKCRFLLFNIEEPLRIQLRILKLNKIIEILTVDKTPSVDNYAEYFLKESEALFDDSFLLSNQIKNYDHQSKNSSQLQSHQQKKNKGFFFDHEDLDNLNQNINLNLDDLEIEEIQLDQHKAESLDSQELFSN